MNLTEFGAALVAAITGLAGSINNLAAAISKGGTVSTNAASQPAEGGSAKPGRKSKSTEAPAATAPVSSADPLADDEGNDPLGGDAEPEKEVTVEDLRTALINFRNAAGKKTTVDDAKKATVAFLKELGVAAVTDFEGKSAADRAAALKKIEAKTKAL